MRIFFVRFFVKGIVSLLTPVPFVLLEHDDGSDGRAKWWTIRRCSTATASRQGRSSWPRFPDISGGRKYIYTYLQ